TRNPCEFSAWESIQHCLDQWVFQNLVAQLLLSVRFLLGQGRLARRIAHADDPADSRPFGEQLAEGAGQISRCKLRRVQFDAPNLKAYEMHVVTQVACQAQFPMLTGEGQDSLEVLRLVESHRLRTG